MKPANMVRNSRLLPTTLELAVCGLSQGDFKIITDALTRWEKKNPQHATPDDFCFGWQDINTKKGIY